MKCISFFDHGHRCVVTSTDLTYLESPRFNHFPSGGEGLTFDREFSNLADYSQTITTGVVYEPRWFKQNINNRTTQTLEDKLFINSRMPLNEHVTISHTTYNDVTRGGTLAILRLFIYISCWLLWIYFSLFDLAWAWVAKLRFSLAYIKAIKEENYCSLHYSVKLLLSLSLNLRFLVYIITTTLRKQRRSARNDKS